MSQDLPQTNYAYYGKLFEESRVGLFFGYILNSTFREINGIRRICL